MAVLPGQLGILAKALVFTAVLLALKWFVHQRGYEFLELSGLLTSLMGGVIFTLAIILAGVLTDFKESERLVGELATHLRRLHADSAYVAQGETLVAMQGHVVAITRAVRASLEGGVAVRKREIFRPLEALDALLLERARAGTPSSQIRTMQQLLGYIVRIVDRLETIVETTFVKAAYYFAALVVAVGFAALTFTRIEPFEQSLFLYGFAVLLISGLFLLVWDLDNPFSGSVTLSTRQLDKLEATLTAAPAGGAGASGSPVR